MKNVLYVAVIIGLMLLSSCISTNGPTVQSISDEALKIQYEKDSIEAYSWLQSKVDDGSISESEYDYIVYKLQETK